MKKQYLFGAAAATLMLAACSQDEVVSMKQDGINYAVFAKNQTRAADSYCNAILPKSITVYARTASDHKLYINGDVIENKSGVWTDADGVRYWPQEGNLDFFAHVNGEGVFDYNSGAPLFKEFVVKGEKKVTTESVEDQLDLMYAVHPNAAKADGPVALNFRHALSQVCFRAHNKTNNLKITINSVSVGHLQGKGTYEFPSVNTNDNIEDQDHNDDYNALPYYPDNRGKWTPAGANDNEYLAGVENGTVVMSPNSNVQNLTCPGNTTHANGFKNVLTLLPQEVNAWTVGNKTLDGAYFVLDVVFENRVEDGTNEDGTPKYEDTPAYTGKVYVPVHVDWQEGYRYIYTFIFNEGTNGGWTIPDDPDDPDPKPALTGIDYAVSIDDFITVPGDDTNGTDVSAYKYNASVKLYNNLPDEEESYANVNVKTNDKPFGLVLSSYEPAAKEGYTFAGWATSSDLAKAGTVAYQKESTFSIDFTKSEYALYAVWTATTTQPQTYTVTYTDGVDGQEVFADQSTTVEEGTTTPKFKLNGVEADPVRAGYTFKGWSPAIAATVTENTTYTAQWEKNKTEYSVTFNAVNMYGANVDLNTMPTNYNKSLSDESVEVTVDKTPTCGNYTFKGWSKKQNWSTENDIDYQPGQTITLTKEDSNLRLYTVWGTPTNVVTPDDNVNLEP